MNAGGTSLRMDEGTTPRMEEVELCREQQSRTMQEQLSRATQEQLPSTPRKNKDIKPLGTRRARGKKKYLMTIPEQPCIR